MTTTREKTEMCPAEYSDSPWHVINGRGDSGQLCRCQAFWIIQTIDTGGTFPLKSVWAQAGSYVPVEP